jgi:hypothetical protein
MKHVSFLSMLLLLLLLLQRQGILEADTACQRQATAAIICLQTAVSSSSSNTQLTSN